ncbi:hypothetical protein EC988_001987 [Linderina pennispora]|nr:hypothetical protein EC988_001987 [Linderina pennispora]
MPTGNDTEQKPTSQHTSAADQNTAGGSGGSAAPRPTPTWDEINETRIAVKKRKDDFDSPFTFCINDGTYIDARSAPPVTGKYSCIEFLSRRMASVVRQRRQQEAQQRIWADSWYARWMLRWQVYKVYGNKNIEKFRQLERNKRTTQEMGVEVIGDERERGRLFVVAPLDVAVVEWRNEAWRFVLRMLEPGYKMSKKYMESWENGTQTKLLTKFWDGTVKMDGLKLAAKMASNIVKGWGDVADEKDNNRKQT